MSTSGSPVARKIIKQSAGYWTDDSTVQQIRLVVEGIDGSEDASGTGDLCHHSGVYVYYPAAETPRRYLRLTLGGGDPVPGGKYRVGKICIGRVVGVGAQPDWAWTSSTNHNIAVDRPLGRPSIRRLAPPNRVWTYGWTSGVGLGSLRTLAADPDYVAVDGGVPIGTEEDALILDALVAGELSSGQTPVVCLPRLPTASGLVTDPTQYMYGLVTTETVEKSGFGGEEGVNEWVRLANISIEEIR
jgi:hypothetical protein